MEGLPHQTGIGCTSAARTLTQLDVSYMQFKSCIAALKLSKIVLICTLAFECIVQMRDIKWLQHNQSSVDTSLVIRKVFKI